MILSNGKVVKSLYNGHKNTTNNREEIRAVLETLKYFSKPIEICIYSDSKYVVDSINNGHVIKGFTEKDYSKKNLDLGHELVDGLDFHKVTIKGVKGHSGNKGNEKVDFLATHAANCLNLSEDIGTFKSVQLE